MVIVCIKKVINVQVVNLMIILMTVCYYKIVKILQIEI